MHQMSMRAYNIKGVVQSFTIGIKTACSHSDLCIPGTATPAMHIRALARKGMSELAEPSDT
jgi:hypothetical protein